MYNMWLNELNKSSTPSLIDFEVITINSQEDDWQLSLALSCGMHCCQADLWHQKRFLYNSRCEKKAVSNI